MAFILKEIHRFEDRQRGCTFPLLDAIRVKHIVISLPAVNMSGTRDLKEPYRRLFYRVIEPKPWKVTELLLRNELVFIIDKTSERPQSNSGW